MKHLIRPFGVFLCAIATKLIIYKHKPIIYIITGSGETSLVREYLYESIKDILPTRRNIEKPEAEFSIPLTIFGEFDYPKNLLKWVRIYLLTILRIIYFKPYKHVLILEINSINQKILQKWLPILDPENIFVIGNIANINPHYKNKVIKIQNDKDFTTSISKEIGNFVSSKYNIKPEQIVSKQQNIAPISKINFAKTRYGNIVIDASYFQFPPQVKSIEEIIDVFPGTKKLIGNIPPSWSKNKFIKSLKIINSFDKAKKEDILILVGNRKDIINLRKELFI